MHSSICFSQKNGTFIDNRDGHNYKWVSIGEQVWMAENMAFIEFMHEPRQSAALFTGSFVYDYWLEDIIVAQKTENYKKFGVLYKWETALEVCPEGWHLPSMNDWNNLAKFVNTQYGGSFNKPTNSWLKIGVALKSIGTIENNDGLWFYSYDTKTGIDLFGFDGRPGGRYLNKEFVSLGKNGIWWSADEENENTAKTAVLHYGHMNFFYSAYNKTDGLSVRCIKN